MLITHPTRAQGVVSNPLDVILRWVQFHSVSPTLTTVPVLLSIKTLLRSEHVFDRSRGKDP